MPETIITVLADLARDLGVPVITPEYEIVLTLVDQPELTAQTLLTHSSLSHTGFFNTLGRLKHLGVVICRACPEDKRVRLYSLDPAIADLIVSRFGEYQQSHSSFPALHLQEEELRRHSENVRRGEKIHHLTAEYQILLYLYLRSELINSVIISLVEASSAATNSALKELSSKGLIYSKRDDNDRRRKIYYLSSEARRAINDSHIRVFGWLGAVRHRTASAAKHQVVGSALSSAGS